jgi:hypothetical protein
LNVRDSTSLWSRSLIGFFGECHHHKLALVSLDVERPLLDGPVHDEPEDLGFLLLTKAMYAVDCLIFNRGRPM